MKLLKNILGRSESIHEIRNRLFQKLVLSCRANLALAPAIKCVDYHQSAEFLCILVAFLKMQFVSINCIIL